MLCLVLLSLIVGCKAQLSPNIVMTHSEVGWTKDMLSLSPPTTTPEIGFKVQINIKNTGNQPIMVGYSNYYQNTAMLDTLTISIELTSVDTPRSYHDFKNIVYNYQNPLTLEPNQSINTSVITFYDYSSSAGGSLQIGSYKAEITWYLNNNNYQINQVEKYPFNFDVASQSQLEQAIKANKSNGIIINLGPFNFNISLFDLGVSVSITVISALGIGAIVRKLWKRKNK